MAGSELPGLLPSGSTAHDTCSEQYHKYGIRPHTTLLMEHPAADRVRENLRTSKQSGWC